MREEELETAIKVVVVGNGAVGKSSMIQRYCKGVFTRDYKKTIGVDFLERQIEWVMAETVVTCQVVLIVWTWVDCDVCCRVNGEDVRLMLWDTAGQEEFDAITKAYYRGGYHRVLTWEKGQLPNKCHCKCIWCCWCVCLWMGWNSKPMKARRPQKPCVYILEFWLHSHLTMLTFALGCRIQQFEPYLLVVVPKWTPINIVSEVKV